MGVPLSSSWSSSKGMNAPSESLIEYAKRRMEMEPLIFHMMIFQWMTMFKILVNKNRPLFARWLLFLCKKATGDDQNKVKGPLYQGFANTLVLCISVSVLRDLHWLPLVISRFPSITIVYFTFPIKCSSGDPQERLFPLISRDKYEHTHLRVPHSLVFKL